LLSDRKNGDISRIRIYNNPSIIYIGKYTLPPLSHQIGHLPLYDLFTAILIAAVPLQGSYEFLGLKLTWTFGRISRPRVVRKRINGSSKKFKTIDKTLPSRNWMSTLNRLASIVDV
jgi:hypothetical protein